MPLKVLALTVLLYSSLYQLYSEYGDLTLAPQKITVELGFEANCLVKK
jgi:hypothetical protein